MIERRPVSVACRQCLALFFSASDVRIHCTADDGARSDDGDLDGEVIQVTRPRAAQHLNLRAALDLKDSHRIALADRVVYLLVFEVDAAKVWWFTLFFRDQLDTLFDERKHP